MIAIRLRRRSTRLPGLSRMAVTGLDRTWLRRVAGQWLSSLERKPSTVGSYRSTIAHAKETFGSQRVRRIGPEDIARFNGMLREQGCSASTRAKHLRVSRRMPASGCVLPLCRLEPGSGAAARATASAGAEGGRLLRKRGTPRLFAHLTKSLSDLCLVALKTGMRQGELLALRWDDVDLEQAVVRVRRSYTGGASARRRTASDETST